MRLMKSMRIHLSSSAIGSSLITAPYSHTRRSVTLFFVLASVLAGFFGTASAALAAKLFAVTATDAGASTDAVYRFEVGPTGTPVLDLTLVDSSFHLTHSIAFSEKESCSLRIAAMGLQGAVQLRRFINAAGMPAFNNVINSPALSGPHGAVFRGSELFIAQRSGNNVLRIGFDASGNPMFGTASLPLGWAVRTERREGSQSTQLLASYS